MKQNILDSRDFLTKLDKLNVLGSIEVLPEQITDGWNQGKEVSVPDSYRKTSNIVVMGMGGSSLGPLIIKYLFEDEMQIPLEVYRDYSLPAYANQNTLVILSSYSGNTEEILEAADESLKRNSKILVITNGGELEKFAHVNNLPLYKINAQFNPSKQPRMAIGYATFGLMGILRNLGIIEVEESTVATLARNLTKTNLLLNPEANQENTAKLLAYRCYEKHVILVSSGHLRGATRVFNNQINENAKSMTSEHPLPEFNHHYMEGLKFPKSTKDNVIFLLFQSALFHRSVQKRVPLTQQIITTEGLESEIIKATAPTKVEQIFEILQLGSYISYYMGMLNRVNPGPVPNVERFKSELKKLS